MTNERELHDILQDIVYAQMMINRTVSRLNRQLNEERKEEEPNRMLCVRDFAEWLTAGSSHHTVTKHVGEWHVCDAKELVNEYISWKEGPKDGQA